MDDNELEARKDALVCKFELLGEEDGSVILNFTHYTSLKCHLQYMGERETPDQQLVPQDKTLKEINTPWNFIKLSFVLMNVKDSTKRHAHLVFKKLLWKRPSPHPDSRLQYLLMENPILPPLTNPV